MQLNKQALTLIIHGSLLVLLITAGAVAPAIALGDPASNQMGFCTSLDKRTERVDLQLRKDQADIRQAWQQQSDRLRVMTNEQQSSRIDLSRTIDAQRSRNVAALRHHAANASQRIAIDTYKATQARAAATRRSTVSQADDVLTAAVKRLVADRQATQAGQVEALRITIDDALQTASGQCAAGANPTTVANDYAASVHLSRETYLAQRKSDAIISAQVSSLSEVRREAAAAANNTYSTTLDQARRVLQASLASAR